MIALKDALYVWWLHTGRQNGMVAERWGAGDRDALWFACNNTATSRCLMTSQTVAATTILLVSDGGGLAVVLLMVAEASYCPTVVGGCPVEEK